MDQSHSGSVRVNNYGTDCLTVVYETDSRGAGQIAWAESKVSTIDYKEDTSMI